MPPWAAPRIIWPFLRIASAPTRPLSAVKLLSLRATWTIGVGPRPVHVLLKVAPAGAFATPLAASAAAARSLPMFSIVSGLSPAVLAATYAWSSCKSLPSSESSSWESRD